MFVYFEQHPILIRIDIVHVCVCVLDSALSFFLIGFSFCPSSLFLFLGNILIRCHRRCSCCYCYCCCCVRLENKMMAVVVVILSSRLCRSFCLDAKTIELIYFPISTNWQTFGQKRASILFQKYINRLESSIGPKRK